MATEVVAYTDPSCPHCHRLKEYLKSHNVPFEDLGGDYFDQRDRDRREQRALATLRNLGYDVALTPRPTPPAPAPRAA